MSKGLGKQQRRILDELKARPAFYLDELAATRSERVSLNRAAWQLAELQLIDLTSYATGRQKVIIKRRGFMFDRTKYERREYDWQNPKVINVE